jgi:hypothetical protein
MSFYGVTFRGLVVRFASTWSPAGVKRSDYSSFRVSLCTLFVVYLPLVSTFLYWYSPTSPETVPLLPLGGMRRRLDWLLWDGACLLAPRATQPYDAPDDDDDAAGRWVGGSVGG